MERKNLAVLVLTVATFTMQSDGTAVGYALRRNSLDAGTADDNVEPPIIGIAKAVSRRQYDPVVRNIVTKSVKESRGEGGIDDIRPTLIRSLDDRITIPSGLRADLVPDTIDVRGGADELGDDLTRMATEGRRGVDDLTDDVVRLVTDGRIGIDDFREEMARDLIQDSSGMNNLRQDVLRLVAEGRGGIDVLPEELARDLYEDRSGAEDFRLDTARDGTVDGSSADDLTDESVRTAKGEQGARSQIVRDASDGRSDLGRSLRHELVKDVIRRSADDIPQGVRQGHVDFLLDGTVPNRDGPVNIRGIVAVRETDIMRQQMRLNDAIHEEALRLEEATRDAEAARLNFARSDPLRNFDVAREAYIREEEIRQEVLRDEALRHELIRQQAFRLEGLTIGNPELREVSLRQQATILQQVVKQEVLREENARSLAKAYREEAFRQTEVSKRQALIQEAMRQETIRQDSYLRQEEALRQIETLEKKLSNLSRQNDDTTQ